MKKFLSLSLVSMIALGSVNVHAAPYAVPSEKVNVSKRAYLVPALKICAGGLSVLLGTGGFFLVLPYEKAIGRGLQGLKVHTAERDDQRLLKRAISSLSASRWETGIASCSLIFEGLLSILSGVGDIKNLKKQNEKITAEIPKPWSA